MGKHHEGVESYPNSHVGLVSTYDSFSLSSNVPSPFLVHMVMLRVMSGIGLLKVPVQAFGSSETINDFLSHNFKYPVIEVARISLGAMLLQSRQGMGLWGQTHLMTGVLPWGNGPSKMSITTSAQAREVRVSMPIWYFRELKLMLVQGHTAFAWNQNNCSDSIFKVCQLQHLTEGRHCLSSK